MAILTLQLVTAREELGPIMGKSNGVTRVCGAGRRFRLVAH
jgi:hypothetical protein